LFDTFKHKAHGTLFESPDRKISLRLYMAGFVDDSSGQVNAFAGHPQLPPEEFIRCMNNDRKLWNDILWSLGRALNLSECSYHHIKYAFTEDGKPFLSGMHSAPPLTLTSADNRQQPIQQKSLYEAHKMLGAYKIGSLKKKSNDHGCTVRTSPFTKRNAWTFYFAIWLTSVGYPLPSYSFTFLQLDATQQRQSMPSSRDAATTATHTKQLSLARPLSWAQTFTIYG
jgi:hypothetical protein